MGKTNERCPLQAECEIKCHYVGHELDCPYYDANARPGYEIDDQEERRRAKWREAEEAEYEARMSLPAEQTERTIETITEDILDAQRRGGEAILTIGRCLIEAKEMLPHGEWLPWLTEKVSYSDRTARRFMQMYRQLSNRPALANLGASKALALLALPEKDREEFLSENNVVDMTTRQLEQAIKDRDEARKAAETAKADAAAAEAARAKMEADMKVVNATLASAREEKERADQEAARLERELTELKNRPVDVAVETVVDPEAIAQARAEAVAEMQAKLDKAKAAKAKAEAQRKNAEDALEQVRLHLEAQAKAEKKAALGADKDVLQFEVLFNQGQELANKLRGLLLKARGREDPSAAQGMERALKALAEAIGRCAE